MVSIVVPLRESPANAVAFIKVLVATCEKELRSIEYELIIAENSHSSVVYNLLQNILSDMVTKCKGHFCLIKTPYERELEGALVEGVKYSKGDIVAVVMSDLSDRISDIPTMVEIIKKNNADVVIGNRNYSLFEGRRPWYYPKCLISFLGSKVLNCIVSHSIHDFTNSFRVYKKEVFLRMCSVPLHLRGREFSYVLLLNLIKNKVSMREIPTVWYARYAGKSNFSLVKDLFTYVMITFKFLFNNFT